MPNTYNIGAVCQAYNPTFSPTVSTDVRVYAGFLLGNPNSLSSTGTRSGTGSYYKYMLCATTVSKLSAYFSGCSSSTNINFPDATTSTGAFNSTIITQLNSLSQTQLIIVPIQFVNGSPIPNFINSDVSALTGSIVQNWNAPLVNNFTDFNANILRDASDTSGTSSRRIMVTGTNGTTLPVAPASAVSSSMQYITVNGNGNQLAFYNYVEIMNQPTPINVNPNPPYTTATSSSLTYTPNDLAYIGIPNFGATGTIEVPTIDSSGNPGIAFSSQLLVSGGTEYKSGYFYGFGYPSETNFVSGAAGTAQAGGSAPSGFSIQYTCGSLKTFFIKDKNNNYLGYSGTGWILYNDLIQSYYSPSQGNDVLFTICKDATQNYLAPKTSVGSIFTIALQVTPTTAIQNASIGAQPNGWSSCNIRITAPLGFTATLYGGGSVTITDDMSWIASTTIGSGSITATEPYTYETLLLPGFVSSPSDQSKYVLYLTIPGSTTQFSAYPSTGTATCGMAFGTFNGGTGTGYSMFIPLNSILTGSTAASSTSIISAFYLWVFVPVNSTVNPNGTNIYIIYCNNSNVMITPAFGGITTWISSQISAQSSSPTSDSSPVIIESALLSIEGYAWSMSIGTNNMFTLQTLGTSTVTQNPNYFYLSYTYTGLTFGNISVNNGASIPTANSGTNASTTYTGFQCRYITSGTAAAQGLSLIGTPTAAGASPSPSPSPSTISSTSPSPSPNPSPTLLSTFGQPTSTTSTTSNQTVLIIIAITATGFTYNYSGLTTSNQINITNDNGSTFNFTITGLSGTGSYTANSITLTYNTGSTMTWIKNYQLQKTWTASAISSGTTIPPLVLGLLTSPSATFVAVNTSTGKLTTYIFNVTGSLVSFTTSDVDVISSALNNNAILSISPPIPTSSSTPIVITSSGGSITFR
jgi:hypothetical protein